MNLCVISIVNGTGGGGGMGCKLVFYSGIPGMYRLVPRVSTHKRWRKGAHVVGARFTVQN